MRYAVILTLGTIAVCAYLLFLASPRYDLGELKAENRELRERVYAMERMMNQGPNEVQTIILIGGGLALGLCFVCCYLVWTECNLRKSERLMILKFQELNGYRLMFQNQSMIPGHPEHPQITYQEV